MGFKEIVFPVRHDRPYGLASASFLILVVFAEIEALAFIALAVVAHEVDLFVRLQFAIAPAAFLVAVVSAIAVALQQRAVAGRIRRYTRAASPEVSAFADHIVSRRPR